MTDRPKGRWYYLEASVFIPDDHYPPYELSELLNDNDVMIDDVRIFEGTSPTVPSYARPA